MPTIVGGLRARLVKDAVFATIKESLTQLGWFELDRGHKPVVMRGSSVNWDEEVSLNTIAISQTDVNDEDLEMGSNYQEDRWTFYADLYAEDEALGTHLIHDVRDILRGKMPSIGRGRPNITVMDSRLATPIELFKVEIEDVLVDRANDFPKPWQRYWYVCRFVVVDAYGDENDV